MSWAQSKPTVNSQYTPLCTDLLKYIYKDSALKNLDASLEKLNLKLAISYAKALGRIDKEKINLRNEEALKNLLLNTAKLNPSLGFYLDETKSYSRYKRWSFLYSDEELDYNFSDLTLAWHEYQKNNSDEFTLSDSDLKTLDLLSKMNQVNIDDPLLKEKLLALSNDLSSQIKEITKNTNLESQISKLEARLKILNKEVNLKSQKIYHHYLDEYSKYCSENALSTIMLKESYVCPFYSDNSLDQDVDSILDDVYLVLDKIGINNISLPEKPVIEQPIPKSVITPHEYQNINYQGNFCRRNTSMVDTVVLHHTTTGYEETADDINDSQIVQHENDVSASGSPDPWYMVAYNYLVTSQGYEAKDESKVSVIQGRPDIIRGAHAGGNIYVKNVSSQAKKELLKFDFQCGYNSNGSNEHVIDKRLSNTENYFKNQIKQGIINANFTTVGVALVGNYAPYKLSSRNYNIGGYVDEVRYPSSAVISKTAKLICELKKGAYKNLTKITDHNYIKIQKDISDGKSTSGTCCPGTLYKRMNDVLSAVKMECPDVASELKLDISPGTKVCSFLKKL